MTDRRSPFGGQVWTRRMFLRASIGSSAIVTGAMIGGASLRGAALPPFVDRLVALLPTDSAVAIGREYVRAERVEATPDEIVRALRQRIPALTGHAHMSDRELRTILGASARSDFADGDVVRLRGWILARTEVLVCAAVALARDGVPGR